MWIRWRSSHFVHNYKFCYLYPQHVPGLRGRLFVSYHSIPRAPTKLINRGTVDIHIDARGHPHETIVHRCETQLEQRCETQLEQHDQMIMEDGVSYNAPVPPPSYNSWALRPVASHLKNFQWTSSWRILAGVMHLHPISGCVQLLFCVSFRLFFIFVACCSKLLWFLDQFSCHHFYGISCVGIFVGLILITNVWHFVIK